MNHAGREQARRPNRTLGYVPDPDGLAGPDPRFGSQRDGAKLGGVGNLFNELFATEPTRPCIDDGDRALSYGELSDLGRRFGTALLEHGVRPGDRVVVQVTKSIDSYALWLGSLAIGAMYVPTNTAYTASEIDYFCTDAGASLLILDASTADSPTADSPTATVALADLVRAATAASTDPAPVEPVEPDTPCALVYTSGTTGKPKGATLSHGAIADNARALHDIWRFSPDDVLIHTLPIFHIHGLFISLHPTLLAGAQIRFLPRFEADRVMVELPTSTVFMGVPTYYTRLLADDRFGADLCRSMRLFTSGSAPMTELVHAEFQARTGHQVVERYGMSEAGVISSNRIGDIAAGSVGHALPGYEIRVTDNGSPAAPGETGVVEIQGPSVFLGYWQRPDANADAHTSDGWFRTGDIGSLDSSGRLTLEGRSSDMIISGGLNIYPKEIELALDAADGIAESAVVGVPHDDFGEAVTAYLVLDAGRSLDDIDLTTALAPLARFKHPKTVHVLPALPRNAMGKVQKVELRSLTV